MDLTKTWTLVRISCINVVDISTFGLINSCLCFVSVQKKELGNSGQSAGKQALMNEHNIHREEDLLCKVFNCKMNTFTTKSLKTNPCIYFINLRFFIDC